MTNTNKVIITKIKTIHNLLKQTNCLPENKRIKLLQKNINLLRKEIKKTNCDISKPVRSTSLELVYEKIFNQLNQIGFPFKKHNKFKGDEKTKVYANSLVHIDNYYKRYRNEIINVFKLGQEYFCNPRFIYKPQQKISIPDFFQYSQTSLRFMPHLNKYGVKSWFNEFAKGRDYIESKFCKEIKNEHPKLTSIFIDIWEKYKNDKITKFDFQYVIMFTSIAYTFAKCNNISTRTIFDLVESYLNINSNSYIKTASYLTTDYFWSQLIPQLLVEKGIFKSTREIKTVEI